MTKAARINQLTFRRDMIAGIIVALIALPLCLGIAQASGAPPFSGLVAGIVGGIVVGACSRSALSVSGPAAGLIAIVAGALVAKGMPFPMFLCAVVVGGLLQLALGFLRAGGLANYLPSSVIEGMLAGIGLTIILKEIPNAVGYARAAQTQADTEADLPAHWLDVSHALSHIEPAAIIISVLGLVILTLWLTQPMKRMQLLPAGLLVVITGIGLNELFRLLGGGIAPLTGDRLVAVPVPQDIKAFLGLFTLPDFRGFANPNVWMTGVVLATVASIETLLCIEATDKLDPLRRYTPGSAELKAQGIGNIVSGLIGGLPITSVIVRSSANINAGARTKVSTIFHGTLLLVSVVTLGTIINHIPEAALSAILIFTGYRLCRPSVFQHMWREGGATQFVPFAATAILVALLGLLEGVGIGLLVAVVFTLRQNMRIPYFYQRSVYDHGELIKLTLSQELSFLNKSAIKETLDHLPRGSHVIIDASRTEFIDFDVLDLIRDFARTRAGDKDIQLSLVGFQDVYKVPTSREVSELMDTFASSPDVPERATGKGGELIEQLRSEKQTTPVN